MSDTAEHDSGKVTQPATASKSPASVVVRFSVCHPSKKHYSRGWCKSCYERQRRALPPDSPVPDIRKTGDVSAKAALDAQLAREDVAPPAPPAGVQPGHIDFRQPEVAAHVASAAIVKQLDMRKAVAAIAPELSPSEVADEAETLAQAPQVQQEIQKQLKPRGLGEDAKKVFVEETWDRFYNGSEKERIAAMRLLGKAFITDKDGNGKPEELPLSMEHADIQRMLGKPSVSAEAGLDDIDEDEDDDAAGDATPPVMLPLGKA